jgi:hypothetical protein
MRDRDASQRNLPRPDPNEPIPRSLWRRCYRIRNRYHSLEDTLAVQGLDGYRCSLTNGPPRGPMSVLGGSGRAASKEEVRV